MTSGEKPVILVVDDDVDTLSLTERFLTIAGYQVVSVTSGERVLGLLQHLKPQLILLDVMMPRMDGYELCARIQENEATAYIPIIFVTGVEAEQGKQRALALGAADYLVKPVTKSTLLEKVARQLETGQRWYNVRLATDLWDERPLPEKFIQFREHLAQRLNLNQDGLQSLGRLRSSEVYSLAEHVGLSEKQLAQQMASFFGIPYLDAVEPQSIQLGVLPTSFCRANQVVAIRDEQGENAFLIANPFVWGLEQLDFLNRSFKGDKYHLILTEQKTISNLFFNESLEQTTATREQAEDEADLLNHPEISIEAIPVADDLSPIQVVKTLISDAVRRGASDLHIEPERDRVRVRYRIDGQMQYIVPVQSVLLPGIAGRIKILSGMDPSESRKPQDGGCKLRVDNREVEMRVSSLPGNHGEIMVIRFLGENAELQSLDALGMEPDMLRQFRNLLAARQGMMLITGPTGSGKSTTLYAGLNHLNTDDVNIITVEDPIEVDVSGINQIQINDRAGRSFATTLRAMLRQDPDIIMVGEIRDAETAEIAARAALTGHLVLSTLHTQHTLGTLTRLSDMGVPSYLVSASLNGVLAQRLVRKVCENCAQPYTPPPSLLRALQAEYGDLSRANFRKGAGCARCHQSGSKGRLGVFEILCLDEDFRHLVAEGAAPSVLRAYAKTKGFRSFEDDAFMKASRGLIAPEEILKLGLGLAMHMTDDEEAAPAAEEAEAA